MGEAGQKRIAEHFTIEKTVGGLQACWEELCGAECGGRIAERCRGSGGRARDEASGGHLREVAGWMLVVAVPGAAWMFGSLPPVAMEIVLAWIVVAAGLWGVSLLLERRRPAGHGLLVIGGLLVVIGWAMTLHPVARYDAVGRRFIGSGAAFERGDGGCAYEFFDDAVGDGAIRGVLDGGGFVPGGGVSSSVFVGAGDWRGVGGGAGDFAAGGAERVFAGIHEADGGAGIWAVQLSWECGGVLAAGAGRGGGAFCGGGGGGKRWAMVAAGMAGAIVLVGICVCTSRTAVVLSVVMLPALAFGFWRMFSPALVRVREGRRRIFWGVSAGMVLAMGLAVLVMPAKWRLLAGQITGEHGRYIVWRMGLGMAQDAGWFGYGPGTFGLMLPVTPRFDPELYRQAIVTYQVPGEQVSMWVMRTTICCNPLQNGGGSVGCCGRRRRGWWWWRACGRWRRGECDGAGGGAGGVWRALGGDGAECGGFSVWGAGDSIAGGAVARRRCVRGGSGMRG